MGEGGGWASGSEILVGVFNLGVWATWPLLISLGTGSAFKKNPNYGLQKR